MITSFILPIFRDSGTGANGRETEHTRLLVSGKLVWFLELVPLNFLLGTKHTRLLVAGNLFYSRNYAHKASCVR